MQNMKNKLRVSPNPTTQCQTMWTVWFICLNAHFSFTTVLWDKKTGQNHAHYFQLRKPQVPMMKDLLSTVLWLAFPGCSAPHSAAALVSLLFSLCSFVSWTSISVAGPLTFHCIFGFTYVKHSLGLCSLTVQPGTAFDKESLHNTFLEWWVMGNALVW